ncbi:GntR family transcriptional regulator [Nonomuraea sp. CA-143628]|uniref:GntR family transcriptional regulator n=1 Tax=Nonomuraea sp. CA-143628 TaxID=3239997 RepID=UPI003D92E006
MLIVIEWKPDTPRWIQVYEAIKARIESGEYAPGDKLPSVLKLQEEFGIATATGQKVLHQLRADGLTYTQPGMGTFVKRP